MGAKKVTREDKVIELFEQRNSPKEIARKNNFRFKEVMDILFRLVGEGLIRRSAIWFSINHEIREKLETYFLEIDKNKEGEEEEIQRLLEIVNIAMEHPEEYKLYRKLKGARVAHGDMYELISEIELSLHRAIKNVLIKEYGSDESGWWRKGVPKSVRKKCAESYEDDDEDPAKEPFCYTTIIHLQEIIKHSWEIFEIVLPKNIVKDKRAFLSKLVTINHIRNRVMHPSKGYDFKPEDFKFVYEFHAAININNWQNKEIAQ